MKRASFTVFGLPETKGSMVSGRSKSTGRIFTKSDNKKLKAWQRAVFWEAKKAWPHKPSDKRFSVLMEFYFVRPAKPKYDHPVKDGDTDKMVRAVLDSLIGACYLDDKHVCYLSAVKLWDTVSRAEIEVIEH